MNSKQLYIPATISVGFQKRSDTYTKSLGYVIYTDHKGVLRKEKSWEGWRDKSIQPLNVDNAPTTGFVLNKGVRRYETNRSLVRVYDPRGFEFEISVPNLLFILTETDCSRGKGLEGEFVYAWDGTELVLLPVGSDEYKQSMNYTKLQEGKVTGKDLKDGCIYENSKQEKFIYVGRFDWYEEKEICVTEKEVDKSGYYARVRTHTRGYKYNFVNRKSHIFATESGSFVRLEPSRLRSKLSDVAVPEFAELVDKYTQKTATAGIPVEIFLTPYQSRAGTERDTSNYRNKIAIASKDPGVFILLQPEQNYNYTRSRWEMTGRYAEVRQFRVELQDGQMEIKFVGSEQRSNNYVKLPTDTQVAKVRFSNGTERGLGSWQ